MSLEFRLLGSLEVLLDQRPLAVAGRRQRALLAILVLRANEVVPRYRLAEALWRDQTPDRSANALAALVARLRRVLPREALATHSDGYELRVDPDAIDIVRFERLIQEGASALAAGAAGQASEHLRSALRLWRGPPLADFSYEPFAESAIRRLEELRLVAIEDRIEADLARGRHEAVVGELRSLVLENPQRERLRGQLMVALYRSGQQTEALATYRDARKALTTELGLEPGEDLRQLERAVLAHDPALTLAPQPAPRPHGKPVSRRMRAGRVDRRLAATLAAFVLASAASAAAVWSTQNHRSGSSLPSGRIAYTAPPAGGLASEPPSDLYVVDAQGTNRRLLSRCRFGPASPLQGCIVRGLAWSPDGTRLAFVRGSLSTRNAGNDLSLYLIGLNGEPESRVEGCGKPFWPICGDFNGSQLAWAPDGSRLIVLRQGSLDVVDIERETHERLTVGCQPRTCFEMHPAWAPNGSAIAFTRMRAYTRGNVQTAALYSVKPDGSSLRRLTTWSAFAEYPAWSPDGSMIAFSTQSWRGTGIHVMAADGSNLHRVSFVPNKAGMAPDATRFHAWSPDGQQIAYVNTPLTRIGVVAELWVVRADGTKSKRLYRSAAYPEDISRPTWSPDGNYIALAIRLLDHPRSSGLFVVNADGTRIRKVASAATDPVWQPSP